MVHQRTIRIKTSGHRDMHDITAQVAKVVVESGKNDLDLEWDRLKEIVSEFFVPVVADPGFRAKAEAWIADQMQFPWDTSIMKVVDVEAGRRTFAKGGTLP